MSVKRHLESTIDNLKKFILTIEHLISHGQYKAFTEMDEAKRLNLPLNLNLLSKLPCFDDEVFFYD